MTFQEWLNKYRPDSNTNITTAYYKDDLKVCWNAAIEAALQQIRYLGYKQDTSEYHNIEELKVEG